MSENPAKQDVIEEVGFDLKVHHVNKKTNRLEKVTPYLRHCAQDKGVIYERGGEFFWETGEPVPENENFVLSGRKPAPKPAVKVTPVTVNPEGK